MEEPTPVKALKAVLLFHSAGPWAEEQQRQWVELTGRADVTTKALCDSVRDALAAAEART